MENIINKIRSYYPVSDEALVLLLPKLKRVKIPAKTTIIEANHVAHNVYFIEKGIARVYITKGGEQVTTWFCLEGDVAYGALSIFQNKPCFEYVETLEDTEAYTISAVELRRLYSENIELANWKRIMQEDHFLWLCDIHFSRLNLEGKERYEKMLKDYPNICNRVKLSYIASFLGMTLPSLSRIRAGK
jgi:signal-transduction protein with cAMP-binding, CBS, and nucleotidyltransferase domain